MAYFPVDRWDSQANTWDATVTNKSFPHYFYYYEADLYINDLLKTSHLALELGQEPAVRQSAIHQKIKGL